MLLLLFYYSISNSLARFKMSINCNKVWKHPRAHAHARTMMDTVLFQGDNWLYFPASEACFSERGFSLTRAHGEQNRASRARFSSAVGIYRRCANDEWARDAQRKAERATERKLMRKRDSGRKKIRQEREEREPAGSLWPVEWNAAWRRCRVQHPHVRERFPFNKGRKLLSISGHKNGRSAGKTNKQAKNNKTTNARRNLAFKQISSDRTISVTASI